MMPDNVIVWVHGDCLSPQNPALLEYPDAPALFVFDDALLRAWQISLKRVAFMYECLLEMPNVVIRRGNVPETVLSFARENGAARIVTTDSVSPRWREMCAYMRKSLPVEVVEVEPFLDYDGHLDLGRFSRYWRTAERYVFD